VDGLAIVIAAVIAPRLLSRVGQSRQTVAKTNAESLARAMSSLLSSSSGE
jgi:type II secretory pathway pseudopilin PulG